MSLPTSNPVKLAELAQPLRRLGPRTRLAVRAHMLAIKKGGTVNPQALVDAALPYRQLPANLLGSIGTLLMLNKEFPNYFVDEGNDPILGPPYSPLPYQAYLRRNASGSLAPGTPEPAANTTRISWTVPDILLDATVDNNPPNTEVTVTVNNFTVFPGKTIKRVMWKRPADSAYSAADTYSNVSDTTSSGATTAALSDNGDNTCTVTLAGGSYTFGTNPTPNGPGCVLHWNDGQEVVLVTRLSATTATVDAPPWGRTKAAQQFTMYNTGPFPNPTVIDGGTVGELGFTVPIYMTLSATVNGVTRTIYSNAKSIVIGVA